MLRLEVELRDKNARRRPNYRQKGFATDRNRNVAPTNGGAHKQLKPTAPNPNNYFIPMEKVSAGSSIFLFIVLAFLTFFFIVLHFHFFLNTIYKTFCIYLLFYFYFICLLIFIGRCQCYIFSTHAYIQYSQPLYSPFLSL